MIFPSVGSDQGCKWLLAQTILLNTLISEFFIIDSPLGAEETVQGLVVLDTNLVIYGQVTWCVLDLRGKLQQTNKAATNSHGTQNRNK